MRDLTQQYDYDRLIEEEKEHYSQIEITDDLREGGVHASDAWDYYWQGVSATLERSGFSVVTVCQRRFAELGRPLRILSLGSGYCGHEIQLSESLTIEHQIRCTDINPDLFEDAKATVAERRLPIDFAVEDLNFLRIEPNHYDLIFAYASIHHVINLEHLFEQITGGLTDKGVFHTVEVVGQNRKLIWEENERFANALLDLVPDELIDGIRLDVQEEEEGMEGIRQQDILPLIGEHFEPLFEYSHGAFMRFVCTHTELCRMLSPNDPRTKPYLDFLISVDRSAVANGVLRPLEIYGLYLPKR